MYRSCCTVLVAIIIETLLSPTRVGHSLVACKLCWRQNSVQREQGCNDLKRKFVGRRNTLVPTDNCIMSHATAGPTRAYTEDYYSGEACPFGVVGTGILELWMFALTLLATYR